MTYVIRYSDHIEADIERGYSCWMGAFESFEHLLWLMGMDEHALRALWNSAELLERWELTANNWEEFLGRLHQELLWEAAIEGDDGQWRLFHHRGLSCFLLAAETKEEALEEVAAEYDLSGPPTGEGQATEGAVQIIANLGGGWWLLECEDTSSESPSTDADTSAFHRLLEQLREI